MVRRGDCNSVIYIWRRTGESVPRTTILVVSTPRCRQGFEPADVCRRTRVIRQRCIRSPYRMKNPSRHKLNVIEDRTTTRPVSKLHNTGPRRRSFISDVISSRLRVPSLCWDRYRMHRRRMSFLFFCISLSTVNPCLDVDADTANVPWSAHIFLLV